MSGKKLLELFNDRPKFNLMNWIDETYIKLTNYPETYNSSKATASLAGQVLDYEAWQKSVKRKYPVRHFFNSTLYYFIRGIDRQIKEAIWWVRYRTINRNHVIKASTLEPGWHDRDQRMLHVNFQILVDFVELELGRKEWKFPSLSRRDPKSGLESLDWEINDEECKRGPKPTQADIAEMKKFLYLWWTVTRAQRIEPWAHESIWPKDVNFAPIPGNQAAFLENLYGTEDQQMLEMLIKIRSSLWT